MILRHKRPDVLLPFLIYCVGSFGIGLPLLWLLGLLPEPSATVGMAVGLAVGWLTGWSALLARLMRP